MDHALHAAFLLDFYGDDEAFAADGDQFVLHRAAFGEAAQISAQRFLNGAALLFDFAANAREFGRGFVVERSIGLDLVAELAEEFGEVDDLAGESAHPAASRSACWREDGARSRAIRRRDRRPGSRRESRWFRERRPRCALSSTSRSMSMSPEKSKRPPTRRNSRISLASDCWVSIQSRSVEGASAAMRSWPSGRGGVSAQEFAQGVELEHARGTVGEFTGHRKLMVQERNGLMGGERGKQEERFSRRRRRQPARRVRGCRNSDDEERAAFGLVLAGDVAVVILDHSIDSAEAEAGAFADRLGGVEGIEHALRFANAGAGIGELQHDIVALVLGGNFQGSTAGFFQSVHGVLDDLDEGLEKLVGIALNPWKIGREWRDPRGSYSRGAAIPAFGWRVGAALEVD